MARYSAACLLLLLVAFADACSQTEYPLVVVTVTSGSSTVNCFVQFDDGSDILQCDGGCYSHVKPEPVVSTGTIADSEVEDVCIGQINCCYGVSDSLFHGVFSAFCPGGTSTLEDFVEDNFYIKMPTACICRDCHDYAVTGTVTTDSPVADASNCFD